MKINNNIYGYNNYQSNKRILLLFTKNIKSYYEENRV